MKEKAWQFVIGTMELPVEGEAEMAIEDVTDDTTVWIKVLQGEEENETRPPQKDSVSNSEPQKSEAPVESQPAEPISNAKPHQTPSNSGGLSSTKGLSSQPNSSNHGQVSPSPATNFKTESVGKAIIERLKANLSIRLRQDPHALNMTVLSGSIDNGAPTTAHRSLNRAEAINETLLNGNLPVAIRFINGEVDRREDAVKIIDEFSDLSEPERQAIARFFVSEKLAWFPNTTKRYVRAFENGRMESLHHSDAMHIVFDNSGKASVEGVSIEAKMDADFTNSSERAKLARRRTLSISMVCEAVVIAIRIPRPLVQVTDDIQEDYRRILKRYERDLLDEETNPEELFSQLVRSVQEIGFLVPRVYYVGGRLTSHMEQSSHESSETVEKAASARFAAAMSGSIPLVAEVEAKRGLETKSSDTTSTTFFDQNMAENLESLGGDGALKMKPHEWLRSLQNYSYMSVIGWSDAIPIWEFFKPDLREQFAKHLATSTL